MMIAIHRRVVAVLWPVLFRRMMIAVNGTLVAAAAGTGNGHQGRTRNRRVNEENGKETDPCRHALSEIKSGFSRMLHAHDAERPNHTPNPGACVGL